MLPVWIASILFVSGAANAFYFPTPYPGPWSPTTKPVAEKAKPDNTASVSTAVKATSASTSRGSLSDVPYVEAERVAKGPEPKGFAIFPQEFSTEGLKTLPHGFVEFAFTSDTSAHVEIRLTNLPEGRGPFSYHIHNERVPDRITNPAEQCKAAMSHLDPAAIGDAHVCDSEKKASCQAGDVSFSRSYGNISTDAI